MEYASAVRDGSGDSCTGSSPFEAGHPGANGSRGAGHRPSVGEYSFKGLSLPRRPLVRKDESRRVYA